MKDSPDNIFLELQTAIETLRANYLSTNSTEVTEEEMIRQGLAAMMSTLGDAFTNYIPPEQLTNYQSKKVQTVVGIGLIADFDREGKARVVAALDGSPADIPEISVGAEIFRVNGRSMRKANIRLLNNCLNGPEGSKAELEMLTDKGGITKLDVERRPVAVEHIRFHPVSSDILFIRIAWFSGTCFQEFIDQLKTHIEQGAKGIILDLRANSGGSIISTRNIFSALCDQEVMYYCRKVSDENIKDRVLGEYLFDLPIVIIINEATFSAGEVLAGALKDYGKATIVGVRSGGKGSMQQVFPIEGKIAGAMRITTATNCTPNGHIIQGNGVEPDHLVELEMPELFVDDGAQNYSREGREYLKQLRAEKLATTLGREKVDQIVTNGDRQKQKAIEVLQNLISNS